jgi:outer membrane protein TolC
LAERSQQIADEALRLARGEYRIGTRTFEELRSSFVSEADIRRQVITSRHSFVDALLSLEEAVGTRVRGGGLPAPALGNGTR